ncbi:MAG TPA: dienelactone hydrolase family protein, partial [Gemmatimonadaceae bacterium]|nr:dienelactone hydrolase family protein [Gemmatimonadaceae bacterium]
MRSRLAVLALSMLCAAGACTRYAEAAHQAADLPAGAADAESRLSKSPRHGEWVMVKAGSDSVKAWVVYPQVSGKAPVVVVVHEIFGLSNWVRAVADQFAADGFIAIAPDLLTGKITPNLSDSALKAQAPAVIRTLDAADIQRKLDAVAQ